MTQPKFASSTTRWYALWQYSFVALLQSQLWLAYSSAPDQTTRWLGVGEGTLDMFLNEGPIFFVVALPFAVVLLASNHGLARSVFVGAAMVFAGAALRSAALLLPSDASGFEDRATHGSAGHTWALVLVHAGSILNAAAAPFVVISPAYLSLVWFPPNERNTATAIATTSGAVGRGIGQLIGPALVSRPSDLARLLLLELGLAALPLACAIIWNPNQPDEPPSQSAADERVARMGEAGLSDPKRASEQVLGQPTNLNSGLLADDALTIEDGSGSDQLGTTTTTTSGSSSLNRNPSSGGGMESARESGTSSNDALLGFNRLDSESESPARPEAAGGTFDLVWREWKSILELLSQPSVVLVALAGGIQLGVYGGWSGVLIPVLSSHKAMGVHALTATQAGQLGSANTFAGIAGAVLLGYITDVPALQRHLKTVVVAGSILSAGLFVAVAVGLPPYSVDSVQAGGFALQLVLCSLAGFSRGGLDPLYFELAAEVGHPAAAGLVGGLICFVYHASVIGFLAMPPALLDRWAMTVMPAAMVLSGGILVAARVTYARRNADDEAAAAVGIAQIKTKMDSESESESEGKAWHGLSESAVLKVGGHPGNIINDDRGQGTRVRDHMDSASES